MTTQPEHRPSIAVLVENGSSDVREWWAQAVDAGRISHSSWEHYEALEASEDESERVRGQLAKRASDRFYGRVEGLAEAIATRLEVRASDVVAEVVDHASRCTGNYVGARLEHDGNTCPIHEP